MRWIKEDDVDILPFIMNWVLMSRLPLRFYVRVLKIIC